MALHDWFNRNNNGKLGIANEWTLFGGGCSFCCLYDQKKDDHHLFNILRVVEMKCHQEHKDKRAC